MRRILLIAVPGGAAFTLLAWSLTRLSSDAIGMAIGLAFGVLAGLPAAALVMVVARGRGPTGADADDWQPTIIEYPARSAITYSDEVAPYYALARRAMGAPALPERRAVDAPQLPTRREIADMRAYLDAVEAGEVDGWPNS